MMNLLSFIYFVVLTVISVTSNPVNQKPPCPIHGNTNINPYIQTLPVYQPTCTRNGPTYTNAPTCANIPSNVGPTYTNTASRFGPTFASAPAKASSYPGMPPMHQEVGNLLLQKLLSSSVIQSILSQQPSHSTPSVINNYFIVPSEVFLNNTESILPCKPLMNVQQEEISQQCDDRRTDFMRQQMHRKPYQSRKDPKPKVTRRRQKLREDKDIEVPHNHRMYNFKDIPTEDEIIKDLRSKFPNIPEHVARDMIQRTRKQGEKQYSMYNQQRSKNDKRRPKINENETTKLTDTVKTTTDSTTDNRTDNTTVELPELGSEDVLPNIDNDLEFDDYYPDFKTDNQAHLLEDIKTEDQPHEERRNKKRRKHRNRHKNRPNVKIASAEIIYKTPPGLDSPDFITTQVNKKYGNNFDFKSFTDKNTKTSEEDYYRRVVNKPSVETVSAGSKVMNYGPSDSEEVARVSEYLVDKDSDGPAIVVAKSYPDDYEW